MTDIYHIDFETYSAANLLFTNLSAFSTSDRVWFGADSSPIFTTKLTNRANIKVLNLKIF